MLLKNAAQKIHVYAYNSTTGAPVTGDAANITAYVSLDGNQNAVPAREEDMLAGTNPESTPDNRRLSELSPERENSHGACNVWPCSPTGATISGQILAVPCNLSGYMRRAICRAVTAL